MTLRQQRGGGGFHRHNADVGVLLLEIAAGAADGAAGADTRHEDIHMALGVPPDLRPGGFIVGGGVGGVIKLAGDEAAGDLPGQLFRLGYRTGHAAFRHQHQLRPVSLQQGTALRAHGGRHGEDHPIALGDGHGRKADAGVAGGGLDDRSAGLQHAGGLRLTQHLQGHPVLGASGGVAALQLGQNDGLQPAGTNVMINGKQRRIAHQLLHGMIDTHDSLPFFPLFFILCIKKQRVYAAIHPLRCYHSFRACLCGTDRKRMTVIRAPNRAHATHGQTAVTAGAIQHTSFSPLKSLSIL